MISCDTCGVLEYRKDLVAIRGGCHCSRCAPGLAHLQAKIGSPYPAAELEEVHDGAGNTSVWVAQYESPRFSFMATGVTAQTAHCAMVQGLKDHATQYQIDSDWFAGDEITLTRMALGQTLRDREVIRV